MSHYRQPVTFFTYTLLLTWAIWFTAAYYSYQPDGESILMPLMILGTFVPFIVSLVIVLGSGNRALKQDFWSRMTGIGRIRLAYTPAIILLLPATILLAIAVSVLFGGSARQFGLSDLFSGQGLMGLLISILAPTTEEIGWRGYGADSLRRRFSLLKASLLFALLWGLWHVPLFFINNNYQNELWHAGFPYVANFFISLVPATVIMNWLYDRNGRSTPAAILFHIMMVLSAEAFLVEESVKFIQTAILVVLAVGLVLYDKAYFLAEGAPTEYKKVAARGH